MNHFIAGSGSMSFLPQFNFVFIITHLNGLVNKLTYTIEQIICQYVPYPDHGDNSPQLLYYPSSPGKKRAFMGSFLNGETCYRKSWKLHTII